MTHPIKGQILLEGVIALLIATTLVTGFSALIYFEFQKFRCTQSAFEATHQALYSSSHQRLQYSSSNIQIQSTPQAFIGTARCARSVEKIYLEKLEYKKW